MTHLTRILAAAALAAAAVTAAGCGGSNRSAAPAAPPAATSQTAKPAKRAAKAGGAKATAGAPDATRCVAVPQAVTKKILHGIVLDGAQLGHVEAVAAPKSPGYYFITSTVSGGGASRHAVATWAAKGLAGAPHVYAVDAFAALISVYGDAAELDADLNIHEQAAYRSRVCAAGAGVSRGAPAPQSGIGNAPANG